MKKFITILAAAIATCGTIGAYAAEGNVNVEKKELAPGKKSHDNVRDFKANATSGGEVILDETFSFCKGSESAPIAIEVDDNMVAPAEMMGGKEGFGGEGLKQDDGAIFVGFEIGDGFLQTPEFFDTDAVTVEFEVKPASKINGTDDLVIMAGNTDEEYMADGTAVRLVPGKWTKGSVRLDTSSVASGDPIVVQFSAMYEADILLRNIRITK